MIYNIYIFTMFLINHIIIFLIKRSPYFTIKLNYIYLKFMLHLSLILNFILYVILNIILKIHVLII